MRKIMSFEANGRREEVWAHGIVFPYISWHADGSCSIYADGMQEDFSVDAGDPVACLTASSAVAMYLNGELNEYYGGRLANLHVCKELQTYRHAMKSSVIRWYINQHENFRMEPIGIR